MGYRQPLAGHVMGSDQQKTNRELAANQRTRNSAIGDVPRFGFRLGFCRTCLHQTLIEAPPAQRKISTFKTFAFEQANCRPRLTTPAAFPCGFAQSFALSVSPVGPPP